MWSRREIEHIAQRQTLDFIFECHLVGMSWCFCSVSFSSWITSLPVRIKSWINGMFPFFFVSASSYIPIWSTHRTSPSWSCNEPLIIWMSMATLRSFATPAISFFKLSYNDLASQMEKYLRNLFCWINRSRGCQKTAMAGVWNPINDIELRIRKFLEQTSKPLDFCCALGHRLSFGG